MASIGFGLDRISRRALRRPGIAAFLFLIVLGLAGFGTTRLVFDDDLRNIFASQNDIYEAYIRVTDKFVDPENELLVLAEGVSIADPATFLRLQDLHFELQFVAGIDSVFSLFALREAPDAAGNAPPVVNDTDDGLTPELAERIRAHPIMGAKLLTADRRSVVFVMTPVQPKAPLVHARQLQREIESVIERVLGDSDVTATVSGFPVIRADIVDVLRRDQIVLNGAGALIGALMSLLVFRSLTAALLTSIPAILAGFTVVGFMGLLGVPITVLTNVVPAVVMILGYADGMHLSFAFRRARDEGLDVAEAEMRAQREVGGACVLAGITTSIAFASLTISGVALVRGFGATGAVATTAGAIVVLVAHALMSKMLGRYWKRQSHEARNFLNWMERPSAAIGWFAVTFARPVGYGAVALLAAFAFMHYSVPPQHSVREHLPANNSANAALARIDQNFGGIFPIQVIVPTDGVALVSAEGLARIGRVHAAVAAIRPVSAPLSLWNLVEWLGGSADEATAARIDDLLSQLTPTTRSRFIGEDGSAIITASVVETSTQETRPLIDNVIAAARAAGGEDVEVTGVTVITVLESARTIDHLNISLSLSVVANLGVIAIAFRSLPVGLLSFLPNILPILATGAILFLTGRGMQFTGVIALTVAFGIAVDDTVHFLNRYLILGRAGSAMPDRLVETTRHVGPVLFGTTIIIIAGLSATLTSGLPTIGLFGQIAATALTIALIGDLLFLPSLMHGFGQRWFDTSFVLREQRESAPA